jgi:hypothetical protein
MNDEWELRWVHVPEGTHLSNSRATPGRERDLLREDGTNKTLGPTESIPAEEHALFGVRSHGSNSPSGSGGTELTRAQQLAVGVITDVVKAIDWEAVFEQFVAPAIKRQSAKVGTRVRSAVGRISRRRRSDTAALAPNAESDELDTSDNGPCLSMSGAEYRERVVSALAAEAYAAWQRGILSNARIEDDLDPALMRGVELVLQGKISSIDEETLVAVMKFLDGSRTADRPLQLSRRGRRRDARLRPLPTVGSVAPNNRRLVLKLTGTEAADDGDALALTGRADRRSDDTLLHRSRAR